MLDADKHDKLHAISSSPTFLSKSNTLSMEDLNVKVAFKSTKQIYAWISW